MFQIQTITYDNAKKFVCLIDNYSSSLMKSLEILGYWLAACLA